MTKINQAWQRLFEKYPILETIRHQGYFDLHAEDIKNHTGQEPRLMTKINFRQVFYPQYYWKSQTRKLCKTHGFFYHQNRFIFLPFTQIGQTYSAQLEKVKIFQFKTSKRTLDLKAPTAFPPPNPKAPFPQANDLDKLLYMIDKLEQEEKMTKEALFMSDAAIAASLKTSRQYDYYLSALKWLNLIERKNDHIQLNANGKKIAQQPRPQQFASIAQICFQSEVFQALKKQNLTQAETILAKLNLCGTTLNRRIQCAQKWISTFEQWIEFK